MVNTFDITEFGAVGDGKTDCTKAIQAAMDAAAQCQGEIVAPSGIYLTGRVKLGPHTKLSGVSSWSFGPFGGTIFRLNDPEAECLIDITGAFGCQIHGMNLDGAGLGENIHGVMLRWPVYDGGGHEDTPTIDDCKIGKFTGDGLHFEHVWCFSVRHSQMYGNKGAGLYIDGWDAFIIDNWFSGNGNTGILGGPISSAITATGNRVEWNRFAGFDLTNGNSINITGNYFDRSYGPGIRLGAPGKSLVETTVTGNIFRRSGKAEGGCIRDPYDSCHIILDSVENCAVTANSFGAGRDDFGEGKLSPDYGAVIRHCDCVVVKDNTIKNGMVLEGIIYDGEGENVIRDNIGKAIGSYD